jgi:hypothetical protein
VVSNTHAEPAQSSSVLHGCTHEGRYGHGMHTASPRQAIGQLMAQPFSSTAGKPLTGALLPGHEHNRTVARATATRIANMYHRSLAFAMVVRY